MTHHLEYSRSFPVALDDCFDRTLAAPLEEILGTRYVAIPGVTRVDGTGTWGAAGVGQERTLHFSDGGSVVETLTSLDRPHSFGYSLSSVSGPMKLLISTLDGRWAFEPVGTGTRVTWSWEIAPANAAAGLAMPAFGLAWQGAARRCFERLETHLLR